MAESSIDRARILEALQAALEGVSTPPLGVVQGLPWSIQSDRSCFWWYAGDEDNAEFGPHALNERAVTEKFLIDVFWLPPQSQQLHTAMVAECWDASRGIQQAVEASVSLALPESPVQGLGFAPAKAGLWTHFSGATFYALELEFHLWIPSADTEGQ